MEAAGCMECARQLLACLHPSAAPVTVTDWAAVSSMARAFRLEPLLFRNLQSSGSSVPDTIGERLKAVHRLNAARNITLFAHLGRILQALDQALVPAIVLKGAYLAEHVYPSASARAMNDVDLLVPRDRLQDTAEVLRGLGYLFEDVAAPARATPEVARLAHERHQQAHYAWKFVRSDRLFEVDLHWRVHGSGCPFHVSTPELWERARPTAVAGQPALALAPEDLFMHLVAHAVNDRFWESLRSFCDLAVMRWRQGDSLDWDALSRRSQAWGNQRQLGLALAVLDELFPGLPGQPTVKSDRVFVEMASGRVVSLEKPVRMRQIKAADPSLLMSRGLATLFPPAEEIARAYGVAPTSPWLPLYYLRRLLERLRAYLTLLMGLSADPATRRRTREAGRLDRFIGLGGADPGRP